MPLIDAEELYKMKIGDRIEPTYQTEILRVPGGWIFLFDRCQQTATSVFVPFTDEFKQFIREL